MLSIMRVHFSDFSSHMWHTFVYLELRVPKYFWGKTAWSWCTHMVQHSTVWRCLLQFQKMLSCDTGLWLNQHTSLLSKANSLRLSGISTFCSTVHHRHFSSLSKLHFMIDYQNLELRLNSLKMLQSVVVHRSQILTSVLQQKCSWAQTSTSATARPGVLI